MTLKPVRSVAALLLLAAADLTLRGRVSGAERFDPKTASFALAFHGEMSAYRDVAVIAAPRASVVFDAIGGAPGPFAATTDAGVLVQRRLRRWKWTAPDHPGLYLVTFKGPGAKDEIAVHAFVTVPATAIRNGLLNGYRIGEYPAAPRNGSAVYAPPSGFIEVTKDNEDTRVSPHFRLKQFVCKEDATKQYPKYLVLQERLPLKLEMVLERVNAMGFDAATLHVMSAYRTPYYNHAIGDVKYSMHQWGSAADIYVEAHDHDRMDDLNHDGRVDAADAKVLYDQIELLLARPENRRLQGGMGFYPATTAHPPFVHVDVRGTAARWQG